MTQERADGVMPGSTDLRFATPCVEEPANRAIKRIAKGASRGVRREESVPGPREPRKNSSDERMKRTGELATNLRKADDEA
jgi:hypothetical protein